MKTEYKGFVIKDPIESGGKAGKRCNKTTSIQVMNGNLLIKNIVYSLKEFNDPLGLLARDRAILKAKKWVDNKK